MKNKLLFFWKNRIIGNIRKIDWIYLGIWTVVFIILFCLMTFAFNKLIWSTSLFTVGFLILALVILTLVIKWGLFDIYSRGIRNWSIKRENKMRKENRLPEKELWTAQSYAQKRSQSSYFTVFVGFIFALILIIISAPFVF
ncbi:DUF3899 domain-containing protein [Mesomycoplasma lagogenitalium]|uniref:DUF3899 domain-containing protein n=1 Tax=Mesomycoplasma lagogenitalium TaxID=171286 RepID=A0ABY8LXH2_9BACT|nr:DUF3899 domain-containing protein [Mesomycoplasma lagogenitalium]WGI36837.1 DUF3899 domain-containing protein [Mesomycoplasma lagogenitalium]